MLDTGDLRKTELIFRGSRIGTIIYFHIGWQRPFPIILKARRLLCICAKIWLGINQKRDCIFIKKDRFCKFAAAQSVRPSHQHRVQPWTQPCPHPPTRCAHISTNHNQLCIFYCLVRERKTFPPILCARSTLIVNKSCTAITGIQTQGR